MPMSLSIAFIGFGEAGQALAAGLIGAGAGPVAAYDILFPEAAGAPLRQAAADIGVAVCNDTADALRGADLVISAVVVDQTVIAAGAAAPHMAAGQIYMDINSTAPAMKREAAALIEAAGGDFVEAAVMGTVPPHGHRVPMLLAGARAAALAEQLGPFGMRLEVMAPEIGRASATKLIRSVFVKGLEAIFAETLEAAVAAGVDERVLASIQASFPGIAWTDLASYHLGRVALHARRRADEMYQAADTLADLGVAPIMAAAAAHRLERCAEAGLRARFPDGPPADYRDFIAALRDGASG
jgi:3-hydroxyisobutyrate dehydrogenase-like beta-hydroxyacid dehydrogenase